MKEESQEQVKVEAEGPADQPLPLLHPLANTIGAPLEAGKELYTDLQKTYLH